MASRFSQTGTQVQAQTQTLSPQQLLVSHLTEMPVEALYERVDQELKDNVSLERDTAPEEWDDNSYDGESANDSSETYDSTADYSSPDDVPDNMPSSGRSIPETVVGETLSFYDQLEEQIGFFHLNEHEEEIIRYLIGSLDDDGLLRISLQQIQDELEVYHNIPTSQEELERILHILQNFEPAGVGARSLQECLLLQVQHNYDASSPLRQKLELLLTKGFDNLMLNRWDRIQHSLQLTDADVARLQHEVRRLNPRPGSSMGEAIGRNLQQITPDFIVETDPYGNLVMSLNNGRVPPLRISDDDLSFLRSYEGRDTKTLSRSERDGISYLRDRVERAQVFIDALEQRRQTLQSTMKAIIRLQRPFFESGDETLLRPMTLDDVAKATGLHLSTVSRVSNSKWVQTTFGIFPLRWFFTSAARLDGDAVSIRSIKTALKEIIDEENKRQPLTDEALTTALQQRGFDVARRTVTKYRVQMGIPVARMRK
ncbi:MAG: RNA polymerase factor sigma-54 [Bacteroidaceae bacterium]|nr:RNA polymerase factor sigma-54 [Bacteroidaceae bacterium]